MTTAIYIPLVLIPLVALAVAWKQLALSRTTTGGYGLVVGAKRLPSDAQAAGLLRGDHWTSVEFIIVARGPGTWYDVIGTLVDRRGAQQRVVERIPRLDNTADAVVATASLRTDDLDTSWFVVDWLAPHGTGVRREAYRIRVRGSGTSPSRARQRAIPALAAVVPVASAGTEPHQIPELEEWRWDRTWKARYALWALLSGVVEVADPGQGAARAQCPTVLAGGQVEGCPPS